MNKATKKILSIIVIVCILSLAILPNIIRQVYAGLLSTASVQLSDSRPDQGGASYTTKFTFSGTTSIQCIRIKFDSAPTMDVGKPAGMVTTTATLGSITGGGLSGWTEYVATDGTLQLENGSGDETTATEATIPFSVIHNPTAAGIFYAQVTTYPTLSTHDCTGTAVDQSNVIALVTVAGVATDVTVEPTLTFSVANYGSAVNGSGDVGPVTTTSTTVPFGSIAAGTDSWGSQTLTVSTNAADGYSVYVRDTQSLTNVSFTIRDQAGTPTSPAAFDGSGSQSSFGYTIDGADAISMGANMWAGLTQSNVEIATNANPVDAVETNIEYKVLVSNIQEPGTYSTVIIYTATPSY